MTIDTVEVRMTNLFRQLGLDSTPEGVAEFIGKHRLLAKTHITDAPFWNESSAHY